jgi:hypothetical protein
VHFRSGIGKSESFEEGRGNRALERASGRAENKKERGVRGRESGKSGENLLREKNRPLTKKNDPSRKKKLAFLLAGGIAL